MRAYAVARGLVASGLFAERTALAGMTLPEIRSRTRDFASWVIRNRANPGGGIGGTLADARAGDDLTSSERADGRLHVGATRFTAHLGAVDPEASREALLPPQEIKTRARSVDGDLAFRGPTPRRFTRANRHQGETSPGSCKMLN